MCDPYHFDPAIWYHKNGSGSRFWYDPKKVEKFHYSTSLGDFIAIILWFWPLLFAKEIIRIRPPKHYELNFL